MTSDSTFIESLPQRFVQIITEAHGKDGEKWLSELPQIIQELEEVWQIKFQSPFSTLSYHFVAPCLLNNGNEAVIKIGFPEHDSPLANEAEMLKLYNGNGAVKFLKFNQARFALLLERAKKGEILSQSCGKDRNNAVEIYIKTLKRIIRKPPIEHSFIHLNKWFGGFEKATNNNMFPLKQVIKAESFYRELSLAEEFLIHGDLHHENILSATREEFLVIDPKGVIGQLGYEISVFLNNHLWWCLEDENLSEILDNAVLRLSKAFEISQTDLRKWAFAQGVLSAWWTLEENSDEWLQQLDLTEKWGV